MTTQGADTVATHAVAIARPMSPGDPYVITCACGFVAEASYPTAALVGAYGHKGARCAEECKVEWTSSRVCEREDASV